MDLPIVVIAFLVLAVLLAVGILVVVALPQLKRPTDGPTEDEGPHPTDRRHSSRTGR